MLWRRRSRELDDPGSNPASVSGFKSTHADVSIKFTLYNCILLVFYNWQIRKLAPLFYLYCTVSIFSFWCIPWPYYKKWFFWFKYGYDDHCENPKCILQGRHIFLVKIYQDGEICSKWPQNYKVVIKCSKWRNVFKWPCYIPLFPITRSS
jgi:hypothetical protein